MSGQPADYLAAVAALCEARVLVPVAATATAEAAVHAHGPVDHLLKVDKEADMAVVMLQAADGRRALLAFSGTDSLHEWDPATRPVPVTIDTVAKAAAQEGAAAVIIDMLGPFPIVLESEILEPLARGHRLVRLADEGFGWVQATTGSPAGQE